MGTTAARFGKYLEEQAECGSIYLWGGQGEPASMLTDEYIRKMETSEKNAKRVIKLRDKRLSDGNDSFCAYDCSGLGVHFFKDIAKVADRDMTADGLRHICAPISKADIRKGDLCFRVKDGRAYHVGYVADDRLNVAEAFGRDKGVIMRTLDAGGGTYWNAFGRPPFYGAQRQTKSAGEFYRELKAGMTGDDVAALQRLLIKAGFACGSIDGVFGRRTRTAVKLFQKSNALSLDGIAGEETLGALGATLEEGEK